MGFIIKILLTAVAAVVAAYLLPGVTIDNFVTALIVALILSILNTFVKPILVGNHGADMNTQVFHFFPVARTAIEP